MAFGRSAFEGTYQPFSGDTAVADPIRETAALRGFALVSVAVGRMVSIVIPDYDIAVLGILAIPESKGGTCPMTQKETA